MGILGPHVNSSPSHRSPELTHIENHRYSPGMERLDPFQPCSHREDLESRKSPDFRKAFAFAKVSAEVLRLPLPRKPKLSSVEVDALLTKHQRDQHLAGPSKWV